jgi:hypothetical protein
MSNHERVTDLTARSKVKRGTTVDLISSRRRKPATDLIGANKTQDRKDSCKKHFMMRYRERYGFICKHFMYSEILKLVRSSKPYEHCVKMNRHKYEIDHSGTTLNIVYDDRLNVLVTLLPPR